MAGTRDAFSLRFLRLSIELAAALWCFLAFTGCRSGAASEPAEAAPPFASGKEVPWHLDRIDQRRLPLNRRFRSPGTGAGVTLYVIDSGVRVTHSAFGKRASVAEAGHLGDLLGDEHGTRHGAEDCHGHGTHVAATAAGSGYGVAPGAAVRAIRVSGCRGAMDPAAAVRAVDFVAAHADQPAVAVMSLSYGHAPEVNQAVQRAIASGTTFVVAGGNAYRDACDAAPSGAPDAITVAASTKDDRQVDFGNFGPCIDLFAPGEGIFSADNAGDTAVKARGGSSIAAAVVAGAAALYLEQHPEASPSEVKRALVDSATREVITLTERKAKEPTPNRLLYIGDWGGFSYP